MSFARIERETPPRGYQILTREGFPFFISSDLFVAERLFVGQELSEAQYTALVEKQAAWECRVQAMRYLANREHGRFELQQKLQKKGHERGVIQETIDRLASENLQSEYRYALLYAEGRLRRRAEGRYLMGQRLAARRVDRDAIEAALDELYSEEQTIALVHRAYQVAKERYGEEQIRPYLRKQGFSSSDIRLAFEALDLS